MTENIFKTYINNANISKIYDFLRKMDKDLNPRLSDMLDLVAYSKKISKNAVIITSENDNEIVGMVAFYLNKEPEYSFWTFFGVLEDYRKSLLAIQLEKKIISFCKNNESTGIECVVSLYNSKLINVHKLLGFKIHKIYYDDLHSLERAVLRLDFPRQSD